MDYYGGTCHHKDISSIKVVKYLLLCTLALLLLGLVTLATHILLSLSGLTQDPSDGQWNALTCHSLQQCLNYLLVDYGIVFVISSIALMATVKENFFFLIASAMANLILSIVNLFIPSYRWSIIFLQLCSALFTLAYTLSVYFKMKLDIRRKKRLEKMANLQAQFGGANDGQRRSNLYQNSIHAHSYDKLVLTNEWLRAQNSPVAPAAMD